jgi:hypothetical protein
VTARWRTAAGAAARRVAPRTIESLQKVAGLHVELRQARGQLDEMRIRVERLEAEMLESRALSLRIAELTDVVSQRLSEPASRSDR